MSKCTISGCRNLQTICNDCSRIVCTKTFLPPGEWISVTDRMPTLIPGDLPHYSQSDDILAFDGKKVCIVNLCKIDELLIFYNTTDDASSQVTHWMPLPKPPEVL